MQKEIEFFENHSIERQSSLPDNLLILDTETTGLDPNQDFCIEVGAILFNVCKRSVLSQISFLLPVSDNSAEVINKIPAEISRITQPYEEALEYFTTLVNSADVMLAHNAAFDREWFGKGLLPPIHKPWICSMDDIHWPKDLNIKHRPSVRDLALAYEVPVWSAHRALTDCIYIVEVLKRCEGLEDLLLHALEPRKLMQAKVSYEDRNLAKNAGFRWNDPIKGAWTRRLSDREALDLNFPVIEID